MADPNSVTEIPLAYANVQSPAAQQLVAIRQAISATGLFLAVLGFIPGMRSVMRQTFGGDEVIIFSTGLLAYAGLAIGSLLGLLRVRLGKWVTIVCLVLISTHGLLGFVAPKMVYTSRGLRPGSFSFLNYYFNYSLPTLWSSAYSIIAIIVLTRRESHAIAESQ